MTDLVDGVALAFRAQLRILPRNDDNTAAADPLIVSVDLSEYAFE